MVDTAPSALDRLRALLPPDRVLTDETSLACASLDAARFSRLPSAVIRVHEAGEVGSVLQVANETLTPVTVRGAGSATTAAATPVAGGWALDLSRLAYVEIDAELGFAHAGPGLTCRALDAAAREFGWFYPPDPSSAAYST
ncbi:MAG: FAD-binding oxidoreductase, partial [Opitutales bacterium]